jgi:urea transporter
MFRKDSIPTFIQGLLRSYSQIFFSESYWFAIPLVLVSFLDISAGLCGLLATVTANLTASLLKINKISITRGFYGFNSLLVGLALGYNYQVTLIITVIALFAGFLTLLFTITLQGVLGKYYLPYLSIPFVFSAWIVLNAGGMLSTTLDNQNGVYLLNKMFSLGGYPLVSLHNWWEMNVTSQFLNSYFLSLGAIFFQFNVLAGFVIAIVLLFYSRIAFILSLIGYSVAYFAYTFLGMDMTLLGYSYIGYNFILGAIAIGGYFYIPSRQSFFWAFAVTPVVALVVAGMFELLRPFHLSIYSLPFNLVLLTFIYTFRFRKEQGNFFEVQIQEGTPERNLYSFKSFTGRFPNFGWLQIKLPFFGEFCVIQGHEGEYTHREEWSEAWDFAITDNNSVQYNNNGNNLKDYYCFGKTVIAPADGSVVVADDGTEDNLIGEVNTLRNWGNTVIIKHSDGVYSKLSHLQKGSVLVKEGDNIHYGQPVGKIGNSGRSPYPHLHFQLQSTPYIGSKTLKYPLYAYIENGKDLRTFDYPVKGIRVKPVVENYLLSKAFNLLPGTKLTWKIKSPKDDCSVTWEVLTTPYNTSYFLCHSTGSVAYFQNDGIYFSFTHFDGDRISLLYYFYLAAFRIPIVNIDKSSLTDYLPVNQTFKGWRLFLHDFTAPFIQYLKVSFNVNIKMIGSEFDLDCVECHSHLSGYFFNRKIWDKSFKISVNKDNSLTLLNKHLEMEALCESY